MQKRLSKIIAGTLLASSMHLVYAANIDCPSVEQIKTIYLNSAMQTFSGKWIFSPASSINAHGKDWYVYYFDYFNNSISDSAQALETAKQSFPNLSLASNPSANQTVSNTICTYISNDQQQVHASLQPLYFAL